MAQRIRHLTTNQGIVGSNPTGDVLFFNKEKKTKKATNGIRTHDLSLTKRVLYQLSYSGNITPSVGIEPTAIGLKGQRSTI